MTGIEKETADRPAFSLLSSVYRTERYLAETIDSVRAQTFPDWELILVDNGMSDEVVKIVRRYADDPRIRLVRQENRGLGGGIDAAAAVARGCYYAVLDSDDLLMPEFCARMKATFAHHPSVDVVGIDAYLFVDGETVNQIRGYRQSVDVTTRADVRHRVTLAEIVRGDVLYYTAAIRAEAWALAGGYSCETPKVEDLALFLRLVIAGCEIRVLDERLARYRLRGDSSSRDPREVESFEESLERAFVDVARHSDVSEVQDALAVTLRRLRFNQAMRRARMALLADDPAAALDQARRAFAQRRSARAAVVVIGLTVAPGVLRRFHPLKQEIAKRASVLLRQGVARSGR